MARKDQSKRKQQFKHNLREMVHHRGWSRKEAANKIGLELKVIRKYLDVGLAEVRGTNRKRLGKICKAFQIGDGVSDEAIQLLWSEKLETRRDFVDPGVEKDSVHFYLGRLLADHQGDQGVKKLKADITRAFDRLCCGKERSVSRGAITGFMGHQKGKV